MIVSEDAMTTTPPEFESVEDRLRASTENAPWRSALEEQQNRNGIRRAEAKHSQLRRFFVDGGYLRGVLVLVNIETGQAAAALEVEHGGEVHTLSLSESRLRKWGPYKRIRAREAAKLLETGRMDLEDVPWHGFQICLNDGTYPEWLFTPTDEAAGDWEPVAREFRRRAVSARAVDGTAALFVKLGRFALAAAVGVIAGGALFVGLRLLFGIDLLQLLGLSPG
jgi:hypothetical protein